ncbi:MAG TPA: molecular chaperone HscC [Bacillota bacterium]|nr:molecular chaperone HscC [Bacillota bacterium]HOL09991.1 molecular chaperone HscC [Bacillota bacterium]HPO97740.1 molecular chaperone HscC [Bacillota bacterium]
MALIGIDLGTTNSLVAYWSEDGVKLIPNVLGSNLTPSVISIDDNDEILVGEVAKQRLLTHPQLTVAAFKRYMGTNKVIKLGKFEFLPEELSSLIIRSLKNDAESFLGVKVEEAIISVPAYFNDTQRKATKRAGELAGLKVERIINEPTAAAIAYGLHQQKDETNFLIFDLGGGTFDVSILEIFENVMEVKSIAGDNYLGGEDFTELIFKHFLAENNLAETDLDEKTRSNIWKQAEVCKRQLGESEKNGVISCTINDKLYEWKLSAAEFENIAKPLINRLRLPIERAIRDAAINPDQLDEIILVGGATKMPLIRSFISKLFGRFPSCHLNPDEVVALGAGIQAGMKQRDAAIKEIVLTDVCPYTLGTEVAVQTGSGYEKGHFHPIIERNTIIPVSRIERFYTISDFQEQVRVGIYQGESRLTDNNIKLGELVVNVPPAPAGKEAIDVRYTYDINGILEVEVTIVSTGQKQSIVIEENPGLMSEAEIKERLKALEALKIHPRDKTENRLLLARGERLYEETLGETRNQIAAALIEFENALNSQDEKQIKKIAKSLSEFFERLENQQQF